MVHVIKCLIKAVENNKTIQSLGMAAFIAMSTAIGAPMTLQHEGMELRPYYDSVGVKTVCAGETQLIEDRVYTLPECTALYNVRYGYYSAQTASFYNDTAQDIVTPEMHASFTDMSYNVGLNTVKKSSMIRNINNGDAVKACNSILLYKYAGGHDCSKPENKICGGVWKRRLQMHELCLSGVNQ